MIPEVFILRMLVFMCSFGPLSEARPLGSHVVKLQTLGSKLNGQSRSCLSLSINIHIYIYTLGPQVEVVLVYSEAQERYIQLVGRFTRFHRRGSPSTAKTVGTNQIKCTMKAPDLEQRHLVVLYTYPTSLLWKLKPTVANEF